MSDLYSRQRRLALPLVPILVVGTGGVGTWAAIIAALAGFRRITICDHDRVEEHNRNRLPYRADSVGRLKVEVLRELIIALRPECECVALPVAISEHNIRTLLELHNPNIVIDCTDRFSVQKIVYSACKGRNIRYIRAGCDIASASVHDVATDWGDAPDGYAEVPSWAGPAVIAGALAVAATGGGKIAITQGV